MGRNNIRLFQMNGEFSRWITDEDARRAIARGEAIDLSQFRSASGKRRGLQLIHDSVPPWKAAPETPQKIAFEAPAKDPIRLPQYDVCEICGFDRAIEDAHIIPARLGGPAQSRTIF
jgi:hypothetical protein